ncbi:MAG TPA: hypothetical protein DCM86_10245 [Verrucomicrobiales bacterium]|nr:hypothetical protein [Verrucomicrobiales bacterium]
MGLGWIIERAKATLGGSGASIKAALALQPCPTAAWESQATTPALQAALQALGFQRIGTFHLTIAPRTEFAAYYFPQAHFYAILHPPGPKGTPFELCCQLDELSGISVTNSPDLETWHDSPGNVTHRLPDAPVGVVFTTLLQKISGHDRLPASVETFPGDFQRALARRVEWKQRQEAAQKVLAARKAA